MRLILTILSGTRAGQRILLTSGETLRVGRTSKASLAIADDPTMSSVHYEVQCAEDDALISDLESRNGLFVNGEPVKQVLLASGDQIRAGRTFFSVALEGSTTESGPRPDDETRAPADATRAVVLPVAACAATRSAPAFEERRPSGHMFQASPAGSDEATLSNSNEPVLFQPQTESSVGRYAVVDGAAAQALMHQAKRGNLRAESLLADSTSPYLAAVAPYLIEVRGDSDFVATWQALLNQGPGILVESQADFDEVLIHARSVFCRRDDAGRPSYFRFHDSKLLYAWLCSCSGPQLESFFGCFTGVIVTLDAGSRLVRLTHVDEELSTEEVVVG